MKKKPNTIAVMLAVFITFLFVTAASNAVAASISSNHATSVSLLTNNGWSCTDDQSSSYDLNNRSFHLLYAYLENRAIRHRIRAEHVICELGMPTVNRELEKNLKVIGFNAISGEQLLIYGSDISSSSTEKNVLIVFIEPQGLVRQMLWATPETQSLTGVRVDFSSRKLFKINGTYENLEAIDVFK